MADLWFRCPWPAWEMVLDATPRPLPAEVAAADLEHLAARVAMGKARRVPGRSALRKRWGLSDWQVRRLLQGLGDRHLPNAYQTPTNALPTPNAPTWTTEGFPTNDLPSAYQAPPHARRDKKKKKNQD